MRALAAACARAASSRRAAVDQIHLFAARSVHGTVASVPAAPSSAETLQWAWQAQKDALLRVPVKLGTRLLSPLIPLRSAQPSSSSGQHAAPEAPDEAASRQHAAAHGTAQPRPSWSAAAALARCAAAQPTLREAQLRELFVQLQAFCSSEPGHPAAAAAHALHFKCWQAACGAAAAALSRCSSACQHELLLAMLRTACAHAEEVQPASVDSTAAGLSSLQAGMVLQLQFIAVVCFELCKSIAHIADAPGLPWQCAVPDVAQQSGAAADAYGSDAANSNSSSDGVASRAGAGWHRLFRLLPCALQRLMQHESWAGVRHKLVQCIMRLWQCSHERKDLLTDECQRVLQRVLVQEWQQLQFHERNALLPYVIPRTC